MSETENDDQEEPTMEEILASIRRIISEDEVEEDAGSDTDEAGDKADAPEMDDLGDFDTDKLESGTVETAEVEAEADEPQSQEDIDALFGGDDDAADDDDVLELTEVVEEEDEGADDIGDLDAPLDDIEDDEIDVFDMDPDPAPTAEAPIAAAAAAGAGLVSDQPAEQTTNVFAQYADALSQTRGVPLGNPNKSVEDIVKELLRPMLREWLDENLPALVERLVEREINRLAGRGEKD